MGEKVQAVLRFNEFSTLEEIVLLSANEGEEEILRRGLARVITPLQWRSALGLFEGEEPTDEQIKEGKYPRFFLGKTVRVGEAKPETE